MRWSPHVTVAAVAERDARFLMVEEIAHARHVLNQPAGHLEDRESLLDAVVREVREETAWHFEPQHVVGVYRWRSARNAHTYVRVAFAGSVSAHDPGQALDAGIVAARWLSYAELQARRDEHRSPLVLRCIDDFLRGSQFPLTLVRDVA